MRVPTIESVRNGDSDLITCLLGRLAEPAVDEVEGLDLGRYLDGKNSLLVNVLRTVRVERGDHLANGRSDVGRLDRDLLLLVVLLPHHAGILRGHLDLPQEVLHSDINAAAPPS